MDNNLYNLLLRSLDGPLSEGNQRRLEDAFETSDSLRAMREQLVRWRSDLSRVDRTSFNPFFAERVMNRLNDPRPPLAEYFIDAFRSVAIGAAVLVIIFSAYNIKRENSFTVDSALGIHHQTLEQVLSLETPFE